jgi:hypothetical protein
MLTNSLFLLKTASVGTSNLIMSTSQSPKVADVALDVIGSQVVLLFHHTRTGGFFLLTLD